MAGNMTGGGSEYAGVQETQPPGQGQADRHYVGPATTLGNLGPCVIVTPVGGIQKVILVLGSGSNEITMVVPDAGNNLCAHCGASTNQRI